MEFQKALFLSSWVICALKVIYKVKVIKAQMTPDLQFSFFIHRPLSIYCPFSIINLISFSLSLFEKKSISPSHHLAISPSHYLASYILNLLSFSLCKPKSACSHFFFLTEISSPILCLLSKPCRLYYYWRINILWRLQWTSDP